MNPLFIDTETCGLSSMVVLIQYGNKDGEIKLHNFWNHSVNQNLELLEWIINYPDGIVGFNLVFDWFHIAKMYTILWTIRNKYYYKINLNCPISEFLNHDSIIKMLIDIEWESTDGPCVKPHHCFDLFLHARKTHYQSTMDRKDIVIRRVPTPLAQPLANKLEKLIPLKDIYFARKTNKTEKWKVHDIKTGSEDTKTNFKDIKVIFAPSSALKALASDAFNLNEITRFDSIGVPKSMHPFELTYAPVAKLIIDALDKNNNNKYQKQHILKEIKRSKIKDENILIAKYYRTWLDVLPYHIDHWNTNEKARQYAHMDIVYTRDLYKHFCELDNQELMDDDDSILACMIGAARWKGYKVDLDKIIKLREKTESELYLDKEQTRPIPLAPNAVKEYIGEKLSDLERLIINKSPNIDFTESTKKAVLKELSETKVTCDCIDENNLVNKDCKKCKGTGLKQHPCAKRAKRVLEARQTKKENEVYDKLILCQGRMFASFKVIGALSSRMSGADKLSVHGIKKVDYVRECFPLAFDDESLDGGDFSGFEVTIAEAVYNDLNLRKDLLTCEKCDGEMIIEGMDYICTKCGGNEGKKFHAYFGECLYPHMTYHQIKATNKTADDKYKTSKNCTFSSMYGGDFNTLHLRYLIPLEEAKAAIARFERRYPGVRKSRLRIENMLGTMRQPGGIGTKVEWHEPAEKVETLLGFPRYYTLENMICKSLFQLANSLPKEWRSLEQRVMRRDRVQTIGGAISSALYAAAFNIQSKNIRSAINHVIQGTGAGITKKVQRKIWDYQPPGVNDWLVRPMNIHDELMTPVSKKDNHSENVKKIVIDIVTEMRQIIPLILIKWNINLKNWAEG